eukprot:879837-Pelagomonas_calceolata.AAC.4
MHGREGLLLEHMLVQSRMHGSECANQVFSEDWNVWIRMQNARGCKVQARRRKANYNAFIYASNAIPLDKCCHARTCRFSSDLFTIDDSLPFTLNIFLAQAGLKMPL